MNKKKIIKLFLRVVDPSIDRRRYLSIELLADWLVESHQPTVMQLGKITEIERDAR